LENFKAAVDRTETSDAGDAGGRRRGQWQQPPVGLGSSSFSSIRLFNIYFILMAQFNIDL
jgi:hypothetical protein